MKRGCWGAPVLQNRAVYSCEGKSFPETLQTDAPGPSKTFGDQNGSQELEVIRCFSLLSPSLKFCKVALTLPRNNAVGFPPFSFPAHMYVCVCVLCGH